MSPFDPQRGAARPLWLALGVLTCVIFGSTINRCLTCGAPLEKERAEAPDVGGSFFVTDKEPETESPDDWTRRPPETPRPSRKLKSLAPVAEGGHVSLTFERLSSWVYEMPAVGIREPRPDIFPVSIQALHGKKVAVKGFMIPIAVDGESVTEFLLVRSRLFCCFGVMPKMNEWLHIKMAAGKKSPYAVDIPITVFGTLAVGEVIERGVVMSLYRMAADEVSEPVLFR
jgi:hypothetical protein